MCKAPPDVPTRKGIPRRIPTHHSHYAPAVPATYHRLAHLDRAAAGVHVFHVKLTHKTGTSTLPHSRPANTRTTPVQH